MKTTKKIPFNKNQVIVNIDTFDTMNKIVKESKKIIDLQPKIKEVFNEINEYSRGYKTLEKENVGLKKEIDNLQFKNDILTYRNNELIKQINKILKSIKDFLKKLLNQSIEHIKDYAEDLTKNFFDSKDFKMLDVKDIAKGTSKEDILFDYANVPDKYKTLNELLEEDYDFENDFDYELNNYEDKKDDIDLSI